MEKRIEVSDEQLLAANESLIHRIGELLKEKGRGSFISPHETLGAVTEEYHELVDAVKSDEPAKVAEELLDVAVACLFGVASMFEYEEYVAKIRENLKDNISEV